MVWVVLGVSLCGHCAPGLAQTKAPVSDADVRVLPDSQGAVSAVLIHYDPDVRDELTPVFDDLFAALPSDVRVTVMCPSGDAADDFSETFLPNVEHRPVDVVNVGLPISIWARDRYIARRRERGTREALAFAPAGEDTYENEKQNDLLALELLAEIRLLPRTLDTHLQLEGGNVVANARHVFVGANVLTDNEGAPEESLAGELRRVLGRNYITVNGRDGDVPWCHTDMYLTPISDDTLLVASPRMAERILERYGGEATLFGDCEFGASETDEALDRLDDIAHFAGALGYRVIRLPALLNSVDAWMVTYNNVIMDHRGFKKTVYLPVYNIPDLDRAAEAIYLGLGFEVKTIDVSHVFTRGGSLRCLVNVTERRDSAVHRNLLARRRGIKYHDLTGSGQYERMLDRSFARVVRRKNRA